MLLDDLYIPLDIVKLSDTNLDPISVQKPVGNLYIDVEDGRQSLKHALRA